MVEHLDGHTDIIHKQLYSDWLPWSGPWPTIILNYVLKQLCKCLFFIVLKSTFHILQGNEAKRSIVAALLEKGRWWDIW